MHITLKSGVTGQPAELSTSALHSKGYSLNPLRISLALSSFEDILSQISSFPEQKQTLNNYGYRKNSEKGRNINNTKQKHTNVGLILKAIPLLIP